MSLSGALFYDPAIGQDRIFSLVSGALLLEPIDTIDFPDQAGGQASRELGIPLLASMDEVRVNRAELELSAGDKELDIPFTPRQPSDSKGIFLTLARPAHVRKIDISYTLPAGTTSSHIVLRAAKELSAGPPIFAFPPFPKPGPLFAEVLGGMTVQDFGSHQLLTLPSILGSSWLIQIATGDSIDKLDALSVVPTINRVTIAAMPSDLRVTLRDDDAEMPLWSHPGLLLPDAGSQTVSFSPLAQKHLTKALKNAAPGQATLSAPLNFYTTSGCAIDISSKVLEARYVVKPLSTDPLSVSLRGGWEDVAIAAPAGLIIESSALTITSKMLGRELNAGSDDPPFDPPSSGLRVTTSLWAAAPVRFLPLNGQQPGSVLSLVHLRAWLEALDDAEAVVELRNQVAGGPGPIVGAPLVAQLARGDSGWTEFPLKKPLPISAGQAPLWITLRSNKGQLLWFGEPQSDPDLAPRATSDGGKSWGLIDPFLVSSVRPIVQLFHASPAPSPPPVIQVRDSSGILASDLAPNPVAKGPQQFVSADVGLPSAILSRLSGASGDGRATTNLRLFSRSALDLKLEGLNLLYDPLHARL